jgi:arylsulfatase A-like enzyme
MISRRTFLASSLATPLLRPAEARYNVLFIAVDDMRPDLGCYGNQFVKTPHLDKLASRGLTFTRTYCQQAVCSPSRTSLLTGRRPDTTKIYELQTHLRKTLPNVVTLPQHFKNNGYTTTALGKIYHGGLDDPASWSIPSWVPGSHGAWSTPENAARANEQWTRLQNNGLRAGPTVVNRNERGPSWASRDVADNALPDGKIADTAVRALGEMKGKPFFLAVGFLKPHLPFVAPKKYFDLYPPETVRQFDYPDPPENVPPIALHASGELRHYNDIPEKGDIPPAKALELIRAYYASLSYTDAQIGNVLNELDRLGLRENTVVIVWGDHGYHLGNHGLWNKHSNFEKAVHVPMIVSVPGKRSAGRKSAALTEFVDIYPSLAEICALPKPDGVEGTSFAPLLDRPNRAWKTAAFTQYPRGKAMGYSIRTERYRYTEWITPESDERPRELYDYSKDPDERINLAGLPESESLVRDLSARLKAGWRGALPDS